VPRDATTTPTVLHVSSATGWRGGESQLASLHAGLARAGVAQVVACPSGSAVERAIRAQGGRVVALGRRAAVDPLAAWRLAGAARQARAGLLHVHDAHAHTAAVLASVFGLAAPLVIHRRVVIPPGGDPFSAWKWRARAVRRVLCVSRAVAEVIGPRLRDPALVRVVPDGVDVGRFRGVAADGRLRRALGIPAGAPLVGNVAALGRDKDPLTFVEVAARLAPRLPEAHFVLVGEGTERGAVERRVAAAGLSGRVHLAGFRDDVPAVLPELDLLLFTSASEGLGSTLLDAHLCRVPVVATRAGGIPEVVLDGETGLLAAVGDADGLAAAALRVLCEPALRARLVAAAERRAGEFSVERMVERTLEAYRGLAAPP